MKNQIKNREENEIFPSEMAEMAYNESSKMMLFALVIEYLEKAKGISEKEAFSELLKIASLYNTIDNE